MMGNTGFESPLADGPQALSIGIRHKAIASKLRFIGINLFLEIGDGSFARAGAAHGFRLGSVAHRLPAIELVGPQALPVGFAGRGTHRIDLDTGGADSPNKE
jgi:hypothetical protein